MDFSTLFIVAIVSAIFTWIAFYLFHKNDLKEFVKSFLDSNTSITFLVKDKKIELINQEGLDFFGYKSLATFLASHSDVSDFFIEEIGCVDKYTHGINWIEKVGATKSKSIKVKIFSTAYNMEYYFQIKVSKLKASIMSRSEEYLLLFTNITELEKEKLRVKKESEIDPLTKAYNRVKLNQILSSIFFNSKKYNHCVTLMLFDIDHFKRINDNFGHNVGDSVLRELSGLVRGFLRKEDIFARWGGEEFVVLLEHCSLQDTTKLASRLRLEIEKYHFDVVENVTCSFGVTQFTQGDTQSLFFERVDEALYEAKENGRNKVVTK
jgi:diguanylate cyclase (GGDEF)-like protein